MRKHTKIYFDYFGYTGHEFIACEVCGQRAVDIHHIHARGMGGSKTKDTIENLMAVCRKCHEFYGDKKQYINFLEKRHQEFIDNYGKVY
jgi:5-methylcytosine-specific restriction endonuclease McrA